MKLERILQKLSYECTQGSLDSEITKVCCNSKEVKKGALFVCIKGFRFDGSNFIAEAIEKGAAAIVTEEKMTMEEYSGTMICVKSAREALAELAAAFYDHPALRLTTIGITGTKGKTTTAYLIKAILERAGLRVGLIGTIETIIGERHIPAENTTPQPCMLQAYMAEMVESGLDTVVMEVSSQGLKLNRTGGFIFDYGIFTNLGEDHVGEGEHADMEEYIQCKSMLFRSCRIGIVNSDDPAWTKVTKGHTCMIQTYGMGEAAMLRAKTWQRLRNGDELGVRFRVSGLMDAEIEAAIPGVFGVYNALAAICVCHSLNIPPEMVCQALRTATVKGRTEPVKVSDDFTLLIDYAHNAMSLKSLLETLKEYQPGRMICLFGCGGNRSKLRRFEMGQVSGELADLTIITSDNPRFEEPMAIMEDIKVGILPTKGEFVEICDRREAIAYALKIGQPGDIIVLAGKGHEDYQEIKGKKYPMDEREMIQGILQNKK